MDHAEIVFKSLEEAGKPLKAVEIADATGLEKTEVDKAMKVLKKEGRIVSPKVCFWTTA